MNIHQFAPGLLLRYDDDLLIITYNNGVLSRFEKTLKLNTENILYNDHKVSRTIEIYKESKILITIDQGGRRGINTTSEIYIRNGEELFLLSDFHVFEAVNNLRQTGCYKLVEYIANKLKEQYGAEWEYKITIDTPEKEQNFNVGMLMMIFIWVAMLIMAYFAKKHS